MTEDNRRANLAAEIERGDASLRAAEVLLTIRLWDDTVSRAYYAAYHHVQALLFTAGLEARTHAGTHDLFYQHFVRSGPLPDRLAKLFSGLQRYREQADYSRVFRFSEEGAQEEVARAKEICTAIRAHLAAGGWLVQP